MNQLMMPPDSQDDLKQRTIASHRQFMTSKQLLMNADLPPPPAKTLLQQPSPLLN
jgi:hypothetical protein